MKRLLLAAAALLAALALAGTLRLPDFTHAGDPAASDTIVVNGVGSIRVVPDEAGLSFGVESRGATAKAALTANGNAMRDVIAALREARAGDITTQYVSVWPFRRREEPSAATRRRTRSARRSASRGRETWSTPRPPQVRTTSRVLS